MNGSPLADFIVACLRARWEPQAAAAAAALATAESVDWHELYAVARDNLIAPLLYPALEHMDAVPAWLTTALRQEYEQNALRNTLLLHEASQVVDALTAAGLPVLVLKGAALAETVYGNVALRPMRDVDLLLHRADVPQALRVLASLGYARDDAEAHAGLALAYENELLLRKSGRLDFLLEPHWSLFDSPFYQETLEMDWFWETAVSFRIGGRPARMLGPEAQLLHLCAHAVLHHGSHRGGQDWLWHHDVAVLLNHCAQDLAWHEVLERAQATHLILPLRQVLRQLTAQWGIIVPDPIRQQLEELQPTPAEARVVERLTAGERPVLQRFWHDLLSTPGWGRRLHYALAQLFPSPAYMRQRYGVGHPLLLPLAYPYRWLVGLRGLRHIRR